MTARADVPRVSCKDRVTESAPDFLSVGAGIAASLERRRAKAG
jgi:hypothetical protein